MKPSAREIELRAMREAQFERGRRRLAPVRRLEAASTASPRPVQSDVQNVQRMSKPPADARIHASESASDKPVVGSADWRERKRAQRAKRQTEAGARE